MASAHYLIRASDGEIAQLVAESNTAYHASSANYWTIGIEHEFFLRRGILFTGNYGRLTGKLVRDLRQSTRRHRALQETVLHHSHLGAGGSETVPQLVELINFHVLIIRHQHEGRLI